MQIAINDDLQLAFSGGATEVQLTPSEAVDLAEKLVWGGIRYAMLDESAKVLLKGAEGGVAFERDTHPAVSG